VSQDPGTELARLAPYLPDIRQAAAEEGVQPQILAAVCLRESLAGWALTPRGHLGFGDKGYGWGLGQADLRTWEPALRGLMPGVPGVDLTTPLGQLRAAARHLASSRRLLRLIFPALDDVTILRASVASYNARIGAVAAQLSTGRDVDEVTTGGDYSRDVLHRAARLEQRDHLNFPPAGG
jgi:hypothetical protein